MTLPFDGTGWAYTHHVFIDPWETSPEPGGPTYRELAVAKMHADIAERLAETRDADAVHDR